MILDDDFADAPDRAWFESRLAEVASASPVPSPCVQICRIDEHLGVCHGCRRTLDEIAAWSSLGDEGKRLVWQQLPGREPAV
jgi:predicted Fe-S protein YdhL (DUF1289 family)